MIARFRRKSIRLQGYNYSEAGGYFVTICTKNRRCLFGEVRGGKILLNDWGQIGMECWNEIPKHFSNVELDKFVVMPNHVHGIIFVVEPNAISVVGARRALPQISRVGARHAVPLLISFEGAEGSGKSTQIRYAVNFLKRKGYSVMVFREPGGTKTSEAIRKVLLDKQLREMNPETELLLYLAARAQLVREKIEPALKRGKVVVLDRYEDSTLAYQGFGGGIPIQTIYRLSQWVRGNLVPNLTFLLDVETRQGLRRSGLGDRVERKPMSFHRRVRNGFLTLARREPRRFVVLSSKEPIKRVRERIERKLNQVFGKKNKKKM